MSVGGLRASVERRIQGQRLGTDPWAGVLGFASSAYGLGIHIRRWCFAQRFLRVRKLPRPVISVGNLCVGGTGKTPLVILLADLLKAWGHSGAVLSRGYGRKSRRVVQVVSDGRGILCTVTEAGDEPLMMAHRLPDVWIWVGSDRHRVGVAALERGSPDVYLLDDGFQHQRLYRDLEIVVLRAPRPLGNGKLIPAGPLREPPEAVKRAQLVVINSGDITYGAADAVDTVRALCPCVPIVRARYRPHSLWKVGDGMRISLDALKGRRVAAVGGIGHPRGLERTLDALGARVARSLFFPDHHWYTPKDIERIRGLFPHVEAVVTTEKDAWKLRETGIGDADMWALRVDMEVQEAEVLADVVDTCLRRAKERL
jgi:tetraacyldisaccharide 4'-kinase